MDMRNCYLEVVKQVFGSENNIESNYLGTLKFNILFVFS